MDRSRRRAAWGAGLVTLLLLFAIVGIALWAAERGAAQPVAAYVDTQEGRLLFQFAQVEVGSGAPGERPDSWTPLDIAEGNRDTRDGPVLAASGDLKGGPYTHARFTFAQVDRPLGAVLDSLAITQDSLEVAIEGEGAPGDALLVTFDAEESVVLEGGYLTFRPQVVAAQWHAGFAKAQEVPARASGGGGGGLPGFAEGAGTGAVGGGNDDSGDGESGKGDDDGNAGGGGGGGSSGGTSSPPIPTVGHLAFAFEGDATGLLDRLDVTVARIALAPDGDAMQPLTRFDGAAEVDLVAASGEAGAMELTRFQVPAGEYVGVHFEFSNASVAFPLLGAEPALLPQPLLVLETGFTVPPGETVTATVRIAVEGSITTGVEGYEFRPVVTGFTANGTYSEDLLAPYPSQYRAGGPWLPLLGETAHPLISEHVTDPYEVPHPLYGDVDRPAWAEGSLEKVSPEHIHGFVAHFVNEIPEEDVQDALHAVLYLVLGELPALITGLVDDPPEDAPEKIRERLDGWTPGGEGGFDRGIIDAIVARAEELLGERLDDPARDGLDEHIHNAQAKVWGILASPPPSGDLDELWGRLGEAVGEAAVEEALAYLEETVADATVEALLEWLGGTGVQAEYPLEACMASLCVRIDLVSRYMDIAMEAEHPAPAGDDFEIWHRTARAEALGFQANVSYYLPKGLLDVGLPGLPLEDMPGISLQHHESGPVCILERCKFQLLTPSVDDQELRVGSLWNATLTIVLMDPLGGESKVSGPIMTVVLGPEPQDGDGATTES